MITTYEVHLPGAATVVCLDLDEVKKVVTANPGARVEPVVHYTPCPRHRAYEQGNCGLCDDRRNLNL